MVFYLLENVYSAFDKLADERKVFKVETIGDCCKFPVFVLSFHALAVSMIENIKKMLPCAGSPNQTKSTQSRWLSLLALAVNSSTH
jgi:Adenylate and Guanylate cyclase catalytic domain